MTDHRDLALPGALAGSGAGVTLCHSGQGPGPEDPALSLLNPWSHQSCGLNTSSFFHLTLKWSGGECLGP